MSVNKELLEQRVLYLVSYGLTPYERINNIGILCENDTILAIGGGSAFESEPGLKEIKLDDVYAMPGFIDTHIHGAGGFDSSTADEHKDKMASMSKTLASHGTTAFLPTIVSQEWNKMLCVINTLADLTTRTYDGAKPIGLNVEGPFINIDKKGAQKAENIRKIDIGAAKELIAAGKNKIKIMTFSPELENAIKLIELMRENNIVPSMGHCIADEQTVLNAISAGASRCTHLFNGMQALHQRNIGLAAIALIDSRVDIELILDGGLIHPKMIELACRAKPHNKIIGISDAVEGVGMSEGKYHLGESEIEIHKGVVTTKDGTLAGTIQTLEKGWKHLASSSHMPLTEAAACLSSNPARSIGLKNRGEITPRNYADIAFFDVNDNSVRLTVSQGRIVYRSPKDQK